jgi:uncharacterized membrane protein
MTRRWKVMTGLALLVSSYAFPLLFVPSIRPPFLRTSVVPLAVPFHLAGGALALALGPFQFDDRLRLRNPRRHRWIGRTYVVSVLLGGIAGFALATVSQGGMAAHLGFATLAVLWLFTVARAYVLIRSGDDLNHRRWMIRNYALTFAAVTLRIYLPLSSVMGVPFAVAYPIIAWLCWVPNAIVAERILARRVAPLTSPL